MKDGSTPHAPQLHVVAANTRAITLYHHLGFETTGEIIFHSFTRIT